LIERKKIPEKCDTEKSLNKEQKALLKEEIDDHLAGNYRTYDMVAKCLHKSVRWRNCCKINLEYLLDHGERFTQISRIADFHATKAKLKKQRLEMLMKEPSEYDSDGNHLTRVFSPYASTASVATEKEIPPVYVFPCFHKPMKSMFAVV